MLIGPQLSAQRPPIKVGAERMSDYIPLLKGKRVGLVTNHTSMIQGTHLVDTLLKQNIQIKRIFAPEHGFRGDAANGELISNGKDPKTGLLS